MMNYLIIAQLFMALLACSAGYAQSGAYQLVAEGMLGEYKIKMDLNFQAPNKVDGTYSYDWGSHFNLEGTRESQVIHLVGTDGGKFCLTLVGDTILTGSFVYKDKTFPVKMECSRIENEDSDLIKMPIITEVTGEGTLGKYKINIRLRCVDDVFDEGEYSYEWGGHFKLQGVYKDGAYHLTSSDGGKFHLYYDKENYIVGTFTYQGKVHPVHLSWEGNRGGSSPDRE